MDPVSKIAGAHELRQFIRRWGSRVSYLIEGDRAISVLGSVGNLPAEAEAEFARIAGTVIIARSHPSFTRAVRPVNGAYWVWDKDILDAEEKYQPGSKLEKFSWNPLTGDFYFITPGQNHASVKMRAPFDDHVRGVILRKQGLVTLRAVWPTWAQVPGRYTDDEIQEINFDAQYACQKALEANGSTGWKWRMNITNQSLEELTGRWRW